MSKVPSAYVKFHSNETAILDSHPAKCWDIVPSYGLVSVSRNGDGLATLTLINYDGVEVPYKLNANVQVLSPTGSLLSEFTHNPVYEGF